MLRLSHLHAPVRPKLIKRSAAVTDPAAVAMRSLTPGQLFNRILADEGLIKGLYRGFSLPLFGTVAETATLFCTNGYLKRLLMSKGDLPPGAELPMPYVLLAGAGTGLAVSFVLTPIELVKCRMQVQGMQPSHMQKYTSTMDCLTRSIREEGLRVLYRGHLATMLRETPGTACWFGAYESFVRVMTPVGGKREDLNPLAIILAGGLGGMAYWAVMYPCDTVKSVQQTVLPEGGEQQAHKQTGTSGGEGSSSHATRLQSTVPSAGSSGPSASAGIPSMARPSMTGPRLSPASTATQAAYHTSKALLSASPSASSRSNGFGATFMAIYRAGGLPALYAGVTPTMLRAVPSNGVIFLVYEYCARVLQEASPYEA